MFGSTRRHGIKLGWDSRAAGSQPRANRRRRCYRERLSERLCVGQYCRPHRSHDRSVSFVRQICSYTGDRLLGHGIPEPPRTTGRHSGVNAIAAGGSASPWVSPPASCDRTPRFVLRCGSGRCGARPDAADDHNRSLVSERADRRFRALWIARDSKHSGHRGPSDRTVEQRLRTPGSSSIPVLSGQCDANVLYSAAVVAPRPDRAICVRRWPGMGPRRRDARYWPVCGTGGSGTLSFDDVAPDVRTVLI